VAAYSAGNHGQGVALSGALLGVKTLVIMPNDAPQLKKDAIKGYGAEVVFFDRKTDDLDEVINYWVKEKGMTYVDPFDRFDVVAGQGTAAEELF